MTRQRALDLDERAMSDGREFWAFRFCLEAEDGSPVPREEAEALLDTVIEWVEARGLQIGGGYGEPSEADRTTPRRCISQRPARDS
jgi:hypothetical protein